MNNEFDISKISDLKTEVILAEREVLRSKHHNLNADVRLAQASNSTQTELYKIQCQEMGVITSKLRVIKSELNSRGIVNIPNVNRDISDYVADIIKENLSREAYKKITAEAIRRKNGLQFQKVYIYSEEDEKKISVYDNLEAQVQSFKNRQILLLDHLEKLRKSSINESDFFKSKFIMDNYKKLKTILTS